MERIIPNKLIYKLDTRGVSGYKIKNKFIESNFSNSVRDFRLVANVLIRLSEYLLKTNIATQKEYILLKEGFKMPNAVAEIDYSFRLIFKTDLIVSFEIRDWDGEYLGKFTIQKVMETSEKIKMYIIRGKRVNGCDFKALLPVEYKKVYRGLLENNNGGFDRIYENSLVFSDIFKVSNKHYRHPHRPFTGIRYLKEKVWRIYERLQRDVNKGLL